MSMRGSTIARIGGGVSKIEYVAGNVRMDYFGVLSVVNQILELTLSYAKEATERWINEYVATRTHQLKDDLIRHLNTSSIVNDALRLELGTDLEYAKYVNKMSTGNLQHRGEWGKAYYYGYCGDVWLYDPKAQKGFFGLLKMEARKQVRESFKRARAEVCGSVGISGQDINRKYKVSIK